MKNTIVEISGGLGNQMFCYASAYAVSRVKSTDLFLDVSGYHKDMFGREFQLSNFMIRGKICKVSRKTIASKIIRNFKFIGYKKVTEDDRIDNMTDFSLTSFDKLYLDSFWHRQNFKLFHSFREEILNEFTYCGSLSDNYYRVKDIMHQYYTVSIHLRYGDYVDIGCSMNETYYMKAIKEVGEELKKKNISSEDIKFIVFSEDIDTAKKIIGNSLTEKQCMYIDRDYKFTDLEEFELMRWCDSHIISNSTFSWWAAYLNYTIDSIVVAPVLKDWMNNGCWLKEYFPEEWIKISAEIKN